MSFVFSIEELNFPKIKAAGNATIWVNNNANNKPVVSKPKAVP